MKKIKNIKFYTLFDLIVTSIGLTFTTGIVYQLLKIIDLESLWPVFILIFLTFISISFSIINKKIDVFFSSSVGIISLVLTSIYVHSEKLSRFFYGRFEWIVLLIVVLILVNITLKNQLGYEENNKKSEKKNKQELFNLFYVNISKVHEIAMLIDNRIMKTIEKEQISENLLKHNNSVSINKFHNLNAEIGYIKEQNSKKKVYENFDVKITKSIMLRKLYDTVRSVSKEHEDYKTGELVLFENIELQQKNINDTVMILNVLRDSNIKNNPNDELELNFKKMMDRLVDDFTIDYEFEKEGKQYIIQLPYKDTESFENGYGHHDLQLGTLSLIGIYRGEIDFTNKDKISSKFLELASEEQEKIVKKQFIMKKSNNSHEEEDENPFKLKYEKLNGKFHLIDTIAIIQELSIGGDE